MVSVLPLGPDKQKPRESFDPIPGMVVVIGPFPELVLTVRKNPVLSRDWLIPVVWR
ncbi:hypothetical protein D3C73_1586260 [compost metagenome]